MSSPQLIGATVSIVTKRMLRFEGVIKRINQTEKSIEIENGKK